MRPRRPVPARLAAAPFSRATGLAEVGRKALAGPSYRSLTRGVHWTAAEVMDHGRRIEAIRVALSLDAVLRGLSAAWAFGVLWANDEDPVEVALPHSDRVRRRAFLAVSGDRLAAGEVVEVDAFGRCTSPARTAFDLARRLPLGRAVAAADALFRAVALGPEDAAAQLQRVVQAHPGVRGCRTAARVVALVDPRAESPRESMLRVALVEAGLPAPVPQFELFARGQFVARLDLAWPEHRVAIEYDGAHHREREQHSRDLARHNRLKALGWKVFQVDADQLRAPERLFADIRAALAESGRSR